MQLAQCRRRSGHCAPHMFDSGMALVVAVFLPFFFAEREPCSVVDALPTVNTSMAIVLVLCVDSRKRSALALDWTRDT